MPDSVTLQFRGVALEDFLSAPIVGQVPQTVLGLGPNIPVTPFVSAISDADAATKGVSVGFVYLFSAPGFLLGLKTRMT